MTACRRRIGIIAILVAGPALVLASPAAATTENDAAAESTSTADDGAAPGTLVGGRIVKQGWWARSNEPPPETGVLAPPSVPAPAAPKGSLPVAQVADEPERIAALQIALDGKSDGTVDSVVLALREWADPTANPNAADAAVMACPITDSFWVGAENGPWTTKPAYDCTLGSVAGVRDETGVWRFDLTSLAAGWLAADSDLPPAVVLVSGVPAQGETPPQEAPAPPSSFQVAFDGAQGLGLVAKTTDAIDDKGDGDSDNDDPAEDSDSGDSSTAGGAATSGGGTSGGGMLDALSGAGADVAPEAAPALDAGAGTSADSSTAALDDAAVTTSPALAPVTLPWHAGLGRGALLLVPVALLFAYACMVALGPAGQPVAGQGRRGVSRALERLRATGTAFGHGKARS
jgi:hypothetical protein